MGQERTSRRGEVSVLARLYILFASLGVLWLGGCVAPVDYGKIQHSALIDDTRCQSPGDNASVENKPYFVVTSRLPDCRGQFLSLTNHRSESVRYGRFAAPTGIVTGEKGKSVQIALLDFQTEVSWWAALSEATSKRDGRVLVYVHGFREVFSTTSQDTAQIARLSKFDGPVIAYSWPSQGDLFKYAVDETNMYWDERNFRRFLKKLAMAPWVKEIVLVSHSLGARLVIPAVEYVDQTSSSADSSNISNIILASPDVDRQDFERDIAEEVLAARRVNNGRRITVYASAKDKALALSRTIHGYPRLGSPYCFDPFERAELKAKELPERCYAAKSKYEVAPEKSGLAIIDTTDASLNRTGHSDYLKSALVCSDFASVVGGRIGGAGERQATHLPHVFRIRGLGKDEKLDNAEFCKF